MRTSWSWVGRVLAACIALVCFGPAPASGQEDLTVEVVPDRAVAAPGGQLALAVKLRLEDGLHMWTPDVPKPYVPVTMEVLVTGDAKVGPVQWPPASRELVSDAGDGPIYEGEVVAYVPIILGQTAGDVTFNVKVRYQACNDEICFRPSTAESQAAVKIELGASAAPAGGGLFAKFDPKSFALVGADVKVDPPPAAATAEEKIVIPVFGLNVEISRGTAAGVVVLLLLSVLGGVILNFTPCVLPVIPLKIMSLQASASQDGKRTLFLGVMMALGVVFFWLAIGLLVVGLKFIGAVNELYRFPWAVLGIGVFIAVMGLGMMGLFSIQLPQSLYNIAPKHDTALGSFGFGIMTAILGTPCFGPFAGGAAGSATTLPTPVAMGIFGGIGVGMALPYLVLAAKPEWIGKLPRTGPGSELIKQVMGLLLMAAAAYFAGTAFIGLSAEYPHLPKVLHWWFVALFVVAAGAWMMFRTFQITRGPVKRAVFSLLAVVLSVAAVSWAVGQTNQAKLAEAGDVWAEYTPAAFEKAIAEGNVVVLDFTAEWCLNCKVIEAAVLHREEVVKALTSPGVVALKADLTASEAPGWDKLSELKEVGIPLLAIYGPGLATPYKSNAYTVGVVLEQIEAARGRPAPQGG
jgi:thiol:disulfide interchange protein